MAWFVADPKAGSVKLNRAVGLQPQHGWASFNRWPSKLSARTVTAPLVLQVLVGELQAGAVFTGHQPALSVSGVAVGEVRRLPKRPRSPPVCSSQRSIRLLGMCLNNR